MLKKTTLLILSGIVVICAAFMVVNRSREPRAVESARAVEGTVEISPDAAYVSSTLEVRRSGVSGAAGSVELCRWFKNGTEISGVTTGTLGPEHFKKGDRIEAEAVLADQEPARTQPVTIRNTPPRVLAASAALRKEPSAAIYVEVSAVDADGDSLSREFSWYRNGSEINGETRPTLDVSGFRTGDNIYALVKAGDGEAWSTPEKSDPIRIGSNAPSITSTPPQALEEGRRFVYQVKASAPDGSPLAFELIGAPDGMTITRQGLIEWVVPAATEARAEYSVVVRVSDPTGGEVTQRVSIVAETLQSAGNLDP